MDRQISKLERSLYRRVGQAVRDYDLIQDGDRIMVAVSGGKDSYSLLHFLSVMQKRAPIEFEYLAVHLDQVQPGYDGRPLEEWLKASGHPYRILQRDTYSVVREKTKEGQAYCFMCSRLRRGILYDAAVELGCTKIALGHHRDDALETLMLNLVFSGQLKSMPPKLVSDDGRNVVIRPLIFCGEPELAAFAQEKRFPILPCNLCGTQENLQREAMHRLLDQIEAENPGAKTSMLAALYNVRPSHLLDAKLYNRLGLPGLATGTTAATKEGVLEARAEAARSGAEQKPSATVVASSCAPAPFEVEDPDAEDELNLEPIPRVFHDALGPLD